MKKLDYFIQKIKERGYALNCPCGDVKHKRNVTAKKGDETIKGSISSIFKKLFGYC